MNYIKIGDNRYILTDDGINQNDGLTLKFKAENYSFESVKADFERVNSIEIYEMVKSEEEDDYVSGVFENIELSSIEYDFINILYIVKMLPIDATAQRINNLTERVEVIENTYTKENPLVLEVPTVSRRVTTYIDDRIKADMTVISVKNMYTGLAIDYKVELMDGAAVISNIDNEMPLIITLI